MTPGASTAARSSVGGCRALVTGATGFIGANLTRALLAVGADVHAVVRRGSNKRRIAEIEPRLSLHEADLTNRDAVRQAVDAARPDVVFHLAKHRGNPVRMDTLAALRTNTEGVLNLLEAVAGRPLKGFVHVGSSFEYAFGKAPLKETDRLEPATVHGATKAAATLLCQQAARQGRMPLVILRVFTVYGPWEDRNRLVPTAIRAALEGGEIDLTGPELSHDWVLVDDVVEALLRAVAIDLPPGEIVNVATGREATNEEVVALIGELTGRPVRVRVGAYQKRDWDSAHWVADVGKAERVLGWKAAHSLRDGLAATIAWSRANDHAY